MSADVWADDVEAFDRPVLAMGGKNPQIAGRSSSVAAQVLAEPGVRPVPGAAAPAVTRGEQLDEALPWSRPWAVTVRGR